MQESILNAAQKMQEEKINVEELEAVLQSDIEEVVKLCKKACLKPKTDSRGNAYFTKDDVSILKKMKELFNQSQTAITDAQPQGDMLQKKVNFLEKAKSRIKSQEAKPLVNTSVISSHIQTRLDNFEKNIIDKMSAILSEKMDGFDEIIVELIRAKTENENLRQQVNSLNKQVYILKNELASFNPVAFGFYTRSETKEL